jgi:hypothetical protein
MKTLFDVIWGFILAFLVIFGIAFVLNIYDALRELFRGGKHEDRDYRD